MPGHAPEVVGHRTSHLQIPSTLLEELGVTQEAHTYSSAGNLFAPLPYLVASGYDYMAVFDKHFKITFPSPVPTSFATWQTTAATIRWHAPRARKSSRSIRTGSRKWSARAGAWSGGSADPQDAAPAAFLFEADEDAALSVSRQRARQRQVVEEYAGGPAGRPGHRVVVLPGRDSQPDRQPDADQARQPALCAGATRCSRPHACLASRAMRRCARPCS